MVEYRFIYQNVPDGERYSLNGATIDNTARISIYPSGNVSSVKFYVDGVFTHKDLGPPFSLNGDTGWPPVSNPNKLSPGPHTLKAVIDLIRGRNLVVFAKCNVGAGVNAVVSTDTVALSVNEIASVVTVGRNKAIEVNETMVIFSNMTYARKRRFVRDVADSLSMTDAGIQINFSEVVSPQILRTRNDSMSISDAGQKLVVSDTMAKVDGAGLNDRNITIDYYVTASSTPIYDQLVLDYSI